MKNKFFAAYWLKISFCFLSFFMLPSLTAWAQISDRPLLTVSSSAKPNLMLLLDNSGSMSYRFVPDDYRNNFAPLLSALSAYQSPDANGLFYDPRLRYTPRQNADGTFLANSTEATALAAMTSWAVNFVASGVFYNENCTAANCSYSLGGLYFNVPGTFSNTLTFSLCTTFVAGICTVATEYTVPPPADSASFVPAAYVPKSAARTDCVALPTRCTWAEERQNALNWAEYYSTRTMATATSIGQAFLDPKYTDKFRLGYGRMNELRIGNDNNTGRSPDPTGLIKRGVRPFVDNPGLPAGFKTERTDFYTWIYAQTAYNGTPSKQLLQAAGQYFLDATNTGPWSAQPIIGDTSRHLECRRSSSVMFSDGAYNGAALPAIGNVDNGNFALIPNSTHVNPKTNAPFVYSTTPSLTATYVAYPDNASDTMSDIAARYWIQDLRPDLADTVTPVAGNPAFWQHMTFYSIGLGIRGSVSSLDIARYSADYTSGIASALNWGTPVAGNITAINDYIHSAYAGRGKSYSVKTAAQVKAAFNDVLSRTVEQAGSDAGVAVADTNNSLSTLAGELKYVPTYSVLEGSGDIVAYTLDARGNVATPNAPSWFASRNIPSNFTLRNLVTMSGVSTGTSLSTTFVSLPADVQTALGFGADNSFLEYLRGKASGINAGTGENFRIRESLIGTIVNSPPAFIRGELNMGYQTNSTVPGENKYLAFRTAKANNSLGILMAPSNNGVLHMINPKSGAEVMGYMPRSVMPKLQKFSEDPYVHKYLLDGPIYEGDVYDGGAAAWKNIAIGTGGRGGKFVYAVSVPVQGTPTGPLQPPTMNKDNLLWEINDTNPGFSNLGNVLNPPQSGYLPNGKWVTIFGNGYYSASGVASLFLVDALTGALMQEISTNIGSVTNPNGLGGVTVVRDFNRVIVAALAGDKLGNMWKFDLRSTAANGGKLAFANGKPLFTSIGNQPFTGAPAWRPLKGGMLVTAATGVLVEANDPADTSVQSIYGVLDKTIIGGDETSTFTVPVDMSKLQLQTSSLTISATNSVADFFKVSKNAVDYATQTGWRLDMSYESGQRNISDVLNLNQTILVTTVVPPAQNSSIEACARSDSAPGYVYLLDAETGGNADVGKKSSGRGSGFDVNGDSLGDGVSVARTAGFPRGNVIAKEQIGPPTETVLVKGLDDVPCDGSSTAGTLIGTGTSGLGLISTCGGGFLRSWRQLLNPPLIR